MSNNGNNISNDKLVSIEQSVKPVQDSDQLNPGGVPPGLDRRAFLMRSAVVGAAAVMTGRSVSAVAAQVKPLPRRCRAEGGGGRAR